MARVTVTAQGWTVDSVVWEVLRDPSPELVEETLRLNRGIAEAGVYLPVGTVLVIPDPPAKTVERATVRLWD